MWSGLSAIKKKIEMRERVRERERKKENQRI